MDKQKLLDWIKKHGFLINSAYVLTEKPLVNAINSGEFDEDTEPCELIPDAEVNIWKCSKCGNEMIFEADPREYVNYCWNCGGKVEKDQDNFTSCRTEETYQTQKGRCTFDE